MVGPTWPRKMILPALCALAGVSWRVSKNVAFNELRDQAVDEPMSSIRFTALKSSRPSARASQALFDWVVENGGQGFENIEVRYFQKVGQSIRGVAVTHDVQINSTPESATLFSVPRAVVLHPQHSTVLNSPFARVEDPLERLMVFLAFERCKIHSGADSFWAPYILTLPTPDEFRDFHPLYAPDDVLREFAVLPISHFVKTIFRYIHSVWMQNEEQWKSLAHMNNVKAFSFGDLWWANAVIMSRAFAPAWARPALIPVYDLINCDSPGPDMSNVNTEVANEGKTPLWEAVAIQTLSQGDELLNLYKATGAGNDILFRLYGYLIPGNPNEVEKIDAAACTSLPREPRKQPTGMRKSFFELARETCQP
eukprot:TRINITY_DN21170_c0_g1_i2.p1 TRINITY_DN21170_c0_g1~~TRINITY_DN21170_c0_g1_i2.p1  ORF type:complete len:375 (+),score=19.46 TRINITY_DN21170_c0_g1_i2:25-1125(+)